MIVRNWEKHFENLVRVGLILLAIACTLFVTNPLLAWQLRAVVLASFLLALLFVMSNAVSLQLNLYLAVMTLAFGWRTERIGGVILDAQQAIAWLLLFHLLLQSAVRPTLRLHHLGWLFALPLSLISIGVLNASMRHIDYTVALSQAGPLLLSIPILLAFPSLIVDEKTYRNVELAMAITICAMAVPGLFEYLLNFNDPSHLHVRYVSTSAVFFGAPFTFWGTPTIGYALTPIVILMFPSILTPASTYRQYIMWLAFLLGTLAIIVCNQRGAWLAYLGGIVAFGFLIRRGRLLILLSAVVVWLLIPETLRIGLLSLLNPSLETGYYDTSAIKRYAWMGVAWQAVKTHPWMGMGLGGAGWVHSDLLQLAANLGIPSAAVLLGIWFYPAYRFLHFNNWALARIWQQRAPIDTRDAATAAASIAALILLATQALIVISALILPIWLLTGMAWARWTAKPSPVAIVVTKGVESGRAATSAFGEG